MRSFFQQTLHALERGPIALALVLQTQGSVPREVGTWMGIAEDRTWGTIGGGAGEQKVITAAQQVLHSGLPQRVEIDLSGHPQRQVQGVCGGWMEVWVARWQGETAIALVSALLRSLNQGKSIGVTLPLQPDQLPSLSATHSASPHLSSDRTQFYCPLHPDPTLLIVGGGHVGVALAQVAQFAGFQVWVQDDRPDFADPSRFPPHTRTDTTDLDKLLPTLPAPLYVALVTRGYGHDLNALRSLLHHHPFPDYVGMIGSQKRVNLVFRELETEGCLGDRRSCIHAPIGLDIGAQTPEEIAVSICAELIHRRRLGSP